MQTLDVRDSNQVVSATQLDAELGVRDRRLLVLSGIALTDWKLDSDELHRGTTQVRLGVYASNLEQWSAFVGLASISNDETPFVFAVDAARVEIDSNTGELLLFVNTALLGEWSFLGRISYQVVATVVRLSPHISGTITWPKTMFTPQSSDVSMVAGHLMILANRYERVSPGTGPFDRSYDKLTPVLPGQIVRVEIEADNCIAYYRIDNPPMAVDLKVTVSTDDSFRVIAPAKVAAAQIAGPLVLKLTGGVPSIEGVNFALGTIAVR